MSLALWLPQAPAVISHKPASQVDENQLLAAVLVSPGSYFDTDDNNQPDGFELDLLESFATRYGRSLKILPIKSRFEAYELLKSGRVDLAVGLYRGPQNAKEYWLGPSYLDTQDVVIVRNRTGISEITDISHKPVYVSSRDSLKPLIDLHGRNSDNPLAWLPQPEFNTDLIAKISTGKAVSAVMPAHEFQRLRHYYPDVRVLLTVPGTHQMSWATPVRASSALRGDITEFFADVRHSGELSTLIERHYSHLEVFDYVEAKIFSDRINSRLPKYTQHFQGAAEQHDLDWRLLAAISHQESRWVPTAKSPTGVRGLMMLTRATAKDLGVKNRLDPKQSIYGGAEYLRSLLGRVPQSITGDDRVYMALAAYNVGLGHLLDARRITRMRNGNPDSWEDVRDNLPLLADDDWVSKTRYGKARGNEPVHYVSQVRRYYDWLVWHDTGQTSSGRLAALEAQ